jgi:DNA-binding response OmpR family regulator
MEPTMIESTPTRVLLVEDEFLIREWVADALREQGFAVHAVGNAADALRHLASSPVDVLFTDINLTGGTDGLVLARRAREVCPGLMVVYASGRVRALDPDVRVPQSLFLPKPYNPYEFGRLLHGRIAAQQLPVNRDAMIGA